MAAPAASAAPVDAEARFVVKVNELRVAKGLPALTVDSLLVGVARSWSAKMAQAGEISHNPLLATDVTSDWIKLGENVGMGGDVDVIEAAFERSPAHYKNLVDADFTAIGIGIVESEGAIYVTQQFQTLAAAPRSNTVGATTAGAPDALSLAMAKGRAPAKAKAKAKARR